MFEPTNLGMSGNVVKLISISLSIPFGIISQVCVVVNRKCLALPSNKKQVGNIIWSMLKSADNTVTVVCFEMYLYVIR